MELPAPPALRGVIQRYAALLARLGGEFGARPLVLPNGDFFPDRFEPNEDSARALVRRMQRHAGIDDIPVKVAVIAMDGAPSAGGCGSGACAAPSQMASDIARIVDTGEGWQLNVPQPELGHPVILTTMAARALARIFLVETLPEGGSIEEPVEATTDLCAVALGFGPLMLQGAYMYSKSCGGPSVAQSTFVGLPELAMAVALFIEHGNHSVKAALKEMDPTQKALLGEAHALVKSNPALVDRLRTAPEAVADGEFTLEETQPWLLRLLRGKKRRQADGLPEDFTIADLERLAATAPPLTAVPRAPRAKPEQDDLKALVDEAFGS